MILLDLGRGILSSDLTGFFTTPQIHICQFLDLQKFSQHQNSYLWTCRSFHTTHTYSNFPHFFTYRSFGTHNYHFFPFVELQEVSEHPNYPTFFIFWVTGVFITPNFDHQRFIQIHFVVYFKTRFLSENSVSNLYIAQLKYCHKLDSEADP